MNEPIDAAAAQYTAQLLAAMQATDRLSAATVIEQALTASFTPARILAEVLDPALVQIGVAWEQQTIPMAQAFVAARIAEDVLLRCVPAPGAARSASKGAVVLGNIEDDFHSLGRRIVTVFLTAAGWEVHDLGNDVLPEQFLEKAAAVGARVVGASAMMQTTALNIRKLRDLIDARGLRGEVRLAVGGAVFNWRPELVAEVGGEGTARTAAGVDALIVRLQAEAKAIPRP